MVAARKMLVETLAGLRESELAKQPHERHGDNPESKTTGGSHGSPPSLVGARIL